MGYVDCVGFGHLIRGMHTRYLEEQPRIPYVTLNSVVGDITYGGRATDAWDKRTNVSILERYFCEEVMTDGYKFSDSGLYYAPSGIDSVPQCRSL